MEPTDRLQLLIEPVGKKKKKPLSLDLFNDLQKNKSDFCAGVDYAAQSLIQNLFNNSLKFLLALNGKI